MKRKATDKPRGRRPPPAPSVAPFLALLEQRAPRPLSLQEMARLLRLERYDRRAIQALLDAEVARRTLRRIGKTRYQKVRDVEAARPPREAKHKAARPTSDIEGRYTRVRGGYGFVEVLGHAARRFPRDILIPEGMEDEALHGDRVRVAIVRRDPRGQRVVGRISAVTGTAHERVIGVLEHRRGRWRLIPNDERLPLMDVIGEPPAPSEDGRVALLRVTRSTTAARGPGGVIEEIVGDEDDPRVQFLGIAFEHGLRIEFPPEVAAEAEALPADPPAGSFAGRADLRALPFVTIDGETARDFDDAVCLERQPGGGSHLRVAIADVSHYVRPGSALDDEAAARGTSVYFPDRAIPMLPEQLSSQLCSLNPERDRLVLVADLLFDRRGQRRSASFSRGVIRSRARLTYTQVAGVLSATGTAELREQRVRLSELVPQLRLMHELMRVLYQRRVAAGSLDLDLPEALVDLSNEGRSVGVRLFHRNDAHRIIEEFMLEANCAVATYLREERVPLSYRIHEPPDPTAIDELNTVLNGFGLGVQYTGAVRPADVQRLLNQLEGHRLSRVLARLVLRSLTQARYSTDNAGHFGLAFPVYCHFTSPIRRYPDLLVHRQLGRVFDGELAAARAEAEALEAASIASSQRERGAMEAERAMLDLKKAEFMLDHLLEPLAGTVVSVVKFGLFIELDDYPVEGLVRIDDLRDDQYTFIEREQALKGLRSRRRIRLGDRVRVEATDISLRHRRINFALLERLPAATQ